MMCSRYGLYSERREANMLLEKVVELEVKPSRG